MTDKELRKLSRKDLLMLLLEQSKELDALKKDYAKLEEALKSKRIKMAKVGSIAEASLQLNGVFESAENACYQYIENVKALSLRRQEIETEKIKKADEIIENAKKKAYLIEQSAIEKSKKILGNQSDKFTDEGEKI